MQFLENPPRNLFFTGKGGVGKTSMACAAAVQLADRGLRVLLVSTDPASNLDEVLAAPLKTAPTPIAAIPTLFAMNLDPAAAAKEYRERMVGPYRNTLPEAAIRSMEEQFSGSCTVEIAAFDEFSKLLGDKNATKGYDHVIFDTAPTGHTLRLLTLPSAWSGFMETNTTGTSCLGPLAGLHAQQLIYQQTVAALSDSRATRLVLVTRPENSAFREAARTSVEMENLGIENQVLIVNGAFTSQTISDRTAQAMQVRCDKAIASMPQRLLSLRRTTVPLAPLELVGIAALRQVGSPVKASAARVATEVSQVCLPDGLGPLIDDLAQIGHGVILVMGKGGVGKTTVAAAISVALAERNFEVHLSTTDPAAHVAASLAQEELPGLTVGAIDPEQETSSYTNEVMQAAGSHLDAGGKALLEEDLRSPCTEEIAVFRAFAKAVSEGTHRFVVLDTAPTGHTILLLDSALAYHREVTRQTNQMPETVEQLLPRLRDPSFTRVLIVTLPEATPVHEATKLQEDLSRADIHPFAWVINQSLAPLAIFDPVLQRLQERELPYIDEVRTMRIDRTALIPWQSEPPIGLAGLQRFVDSSKPISQ